MLIVEFDRPPSWFLDVSKTGEYKMPVGKGGGINGIGCEVVEKIGRL